MLELATTNRVMIIKKVFTTWKCTCVKASPMVVLILKNEVPYLNGHFVLVMFQTETNKIRNNFIID